LSELYRQLLIAPLKRWIVSQARKRHANLHLTCKV
jgi:hypothetical protein